ncbi:MAG: response regulator [Ginsengibacter sp.]
MANILLFDDNVELLEMFQFLFTIHHYEIRTVNSKDLFYTKLQESKPDLIILDIMLKDADGTEICKELKEDKETLDIPVILISASPNKLLDYGNCNADAVIEKPFTMAVLINKIKSLLGHPVF